MSVLGNDEGSVSVAIEHVAPARWDQDGFIPEIKGRKHTLYQTPGYASVN
ncbi:MULTISPECIES: hypothetical protein [unclassified Rhizobium]|nr:MULTISPECIES: hypothetical protein [unclassified Rhizobium]MBB3543520.1 phenylpyruvate tautomerase PptA (4-oxalocrotonate tautomerase family) [Rhizobium sp. BK399]MCS3742748.1 phenylpyruvate tautomerase PptA (4-oxalocrotonate tautomerase family) [Rhizobium sp. BK661]